MKKYLLYIITGLFCVACSHSPKSNKKELLIFCAASLTDLITELTDLYESETNTDVQINFASSGTLARQIEHGAQAAVYISANEKWIDYLVGLNLLLPESKQSIAHNSLVLIAPVDSNLDSISFNNGLIDYLGGRLAMGDPKHVPAGEYARQAIESIGLTGELKEKILPAKDVRSALILVELGEAEMGIVYKTDALRSDGVKVIAEISDEMHNPVYLFSAILKGKDNTETRYFYNFLRSNEVRHIWHKHGFKID